MPVEKFKALTISEVQNNFTREVAERTLDDLPDGEVLIKVKYSSLNYKDALSAAGNKGVTRNYPHTPGVDAAGVVEYSKGDHFKVGDEVIVHGYDLGMDTCGGFGQYIRVPSSWVVKLPTGLTLKESMMYGTAGFTAAQSVWKIQENETTKKQGRILVTGATGGVGSLAVAILNKAGYEVIASTGKSKQKEFLQNIGASEVISRESTDDQTGKLLLKGLWDGAIDTVGGNILATALKSIKQRGVVTTCGNVASHELNTNVYPFILRGISLIGIDSASCPMDKRVQIWKKLSSEWKLSCLDEICREVSLENLSEEIDLTLEGGQVGRVVVNLWN